MLPLLMKYVKDFEITIKSILKTLSTIISREVIVYLLNESDLLQLIVVINQAPHLTLPPLPSLWLIRADSLWQLLELHLLLGMEGKETVGESLKRRMLRVEHPGDLR